MSKSKRDDGLAAFRPHEKWCVDRTDLFNRHGYVLRPRYRPGWVPSWHGTGKEEIYCEDSYPQLVFLAFFPLR